MKNTLIFLAIALLAACGTPKDGQSETGTVSGVPTLTNDLSYRGSVSAQMESGKAQTSADNTASNKRDRDNAALTPMDQGNSESDRNITQDIRKAVVENEKSLAAKNIKIITVNGIVTLRGVVKTSDEKTDIQRRAASVTGVREVDNQLEVAR